MIDRRKFLSALGLGSSAAVVAPAAAVLAAPSRTLAQSTPATGDSTPSEYGAPHDAVAVTVRAVPGAFGPLPSLGSGLTTPF